MRRTIALASRLLAAAGAVLLLAGFLGRLHPAFDTLAHFRLHGAVAVLALAGVALVLAPRRRLAAAGLLVALVALASTVSGLRWREADGPAPHRLLSFNLRFDNPDTNAVARTIAEADADIVLIQEFSNSWAARLDLIAAGYPYRDHCPEWSAIGGVMILSRLPFAGPQRACGDYASLGLRDVTIEGRTVAVGAVHLRWPWPASGPRQIEALAPVLDGLGQHALIAGDFNATTWSRSIRRFAELGQMNRVLGIGPSWIHESLPPGLARWIGLPIDNVMAKGGVDVLWARTLPPAGSDHLPILVGFAMSPS